MILQVVKRIVNIRLQQHQRNRGYKCNEQQCDEEKADHRHCFFGDIHDRYISQRAGDKEVDANRRSDEANCKVHDHDHTELDRVHADCFDDRKQDRCEDQNRRSRVHHHADDQQKAVEHEQERDCPST